MGKIYIGIYSPGKTSDSGVKSFLEPLVIYGNILTRQSLRFWCKTFFRTTAYQKITATFVHGDDFFSLFYYKYL